MSDPSVAALAEAMHNQDETCNAAYYLPFADCATQEFDIQQAEAVEEDLRALGWQIVRDPAGTLPLDLAS